MNFHKKLYDTVTSNQGRNKYYLHIKRKEEEEEKGRRRQGEEREEKTLVP